MNFTEAIVLAVEKVKAWIQSGGVKWDHVSDKPFVKVGGDTLTWDGNTEGLVSVDDFAWKISDAVPTKEDFANGLSWIMDGENVELDAATLQEAFGEDGFMTTGTFFVVPYNEYDAGDGIVFPKKGIYFVYMEGSYISSLTIPGYTGFAKEQIDTKVLPEALQFGKTTVQGDTLEWDGNTEGLETFDVYFKVSDVALSANDFANGCTVIMSDGEAIPVDGVNNVQEGVIGDSSGLFMVVGEGLEFSAGLYFMNTGEFYVKSLTIPGYSGFTKTEIKPIKPEYLPGAVVLYADESSYLYATEDTSDTSKRVTKAELQALLLSGRSLFVYLPMYMGYYVPAAYASFETYFEIILPMTYSMKDNNTGEVTYDTQYLSLHTAEYTA